MPRKGDISVTSGIANVKLMKTTQSGFKGFIEDEYTNLKPVGEGSQSPDRIMCTKLEATWSYGKAPEGNFQTSNAEILQCLVGKWFPVR